MSKKYPKDKSEKEWKEQLDEQSFHVLRNKGTEYPRSGVYNLHFENGSYSCKGCNQPLFLSDQKFESGCGWPSFDEAIEGAVEYKKDTTHNMLRTEILCTQCGGHLGHVFNDGPTPKGVRYCVNSVSLHFNPS
ncbi:MAG: peptide-methionine (R)-S-oxide reductase MsrB [Flavobacteriaceae bacterium]|nr:peptide-methionine (R)-S-oxide reductase MsrB [Flavobacteriaceae bacterium]MDG2315098.1 peptide-methionine (R)-S-oxide reductase MsrB [Flavobacteriaceae bacterium]